MKAVTAFILLSLLTGHSFAQEPSPLRFLEGTWRITDRHYCPHICALSNEEADAYQGRILTYSATDVSNGKHSCTSPVFTVQAWEPDEYHAYSRFDPTEIGLKNGDPVLEIDIQCTVEIELGGHIIIKDPDTILVGLDGVYFEARRVAGIL